MSEESLKKKHLSGSEKRKKRLEQQNKRDEVLKKTYNLFKLGFSRQSPEIQPSPSTSTGQSSDTNVVELPSECSEQTQQDKETSTSKCADGGEDEVQILNQSIEQLGVEYQNDIGIWQNINNEIQDFWCARDPYECQNFECDFSASSRQYDDTKRFFSQSMFFRKHVSGGKIKREWLMYSPSTGKVFCFPCVLFGEEQSRSQFKTGFSDWKMRQTECKPMRIIQNTKNVFIPLLVDAVFMDELTPLWKFPSTKKENIGHKFYKD
ncbi:zinc finger MYM-type protein 5-like [Eupeodes corollae]|uniref:zinc finger MYM-type protein 5-like n=1 Tax=Eupeodes corollae TaxID=290404 RepID=UPI002492C908|nr:zinc finger MYM-type protein 5-like [Eupeodes corollae]